MASTGWQCTCEDGFEGLNCETNIDECLSNDCKNNATCVDGIAEYSCNCTETWKGKVLMRKKNQVVRIMGLMPSKKSTFCVFRNLVILVK